MVGKADFLFLPIRQLQINVFATVESPARAVDDFYSYFAQCVFKPLAHCVLRVVLVQILLVVELVVDIVFPPAFERVSFRIFELCEKVELIAVIVFDFVFPAAFGYFVGLRIAVIAVVFLPAFLPFRHIVAYVFFAVGFHPCRASPFGLF